MKAFKRLTAGLMSVMMLAGVMTGCSSSSESDKNKKSDIPDEFEEDSEWYNITNVDVSGNYDSNIYDFLDYRFVGMYNGGFVIDVTGYLKAPDTASISETYTNNLDYYDAGGELISSVDLTKLIDSEDYYFESLTLNGDSVNMVYTIWNTDGEGFVESSETKSISVNLATGEATNPVDYDNPAMDDDGSYENRFEFGDKVVETYWVNFNDMDYSYQLIVRDADGNQTSLDLHDLFPNVSIYDISQGFMIDDENALLIGYSGGSGDGSNYYFVLNLTTNEITLGEEEDYAWLSELSLWGATTIPGKGTYIIPWDGDGICRLDFENKTLETVVDFNCCNVNRYNLMNLSIAAVDDEGIILVGNSMDKEGFAIYKFVEADTNPNAGKTILKAASLTGLNYSICEAIYRFNEQSDSYFIAIDDRYNTYDSNAGMDVISGGMADDDYTVASLTNEAEIGDQMAVDIMAGDGPDILFNGASLSQLNKSDYLMDLTDLISDDSSYFTNITDALKVDGKVYQVPVSFELVGIVTDEQYVSDGQVGFTFDQYVDFVDRVCNGNDPISMTQLEYFSLCYSAMSPLFYDGHSVNFKNDDFTALAEYIKNFVTDPIDPYSDVYADYAMVPSDEEDNKASFTAIYNLESFLWQADSDFTRTRILGIPSSDGRGPAFDIDMSVAVSSQGKHVDACMDFVRTLLSDDFQEYVGSNQYSNPISRVAYRNLAQAAVDSYNENIDWYLENFTKRELEQFGLPTATIDNSVIDYYESIINSSVSPTLTDASIALIMREEIQAYFLGQRDLATVADTMTNRVTTYINERG